MVLGSSNTSDDQLKYIGWKKFSTNFSHIISVWKKRLPSPCSLKDPQRYYMKPKSDKSPCCVDAQTMFRNWLQLWLKLLLDATHGGYLMSNTFEDVIVIIERMSLRDYQGKYNRNSTQSKVGIIKLNAKNAISL